jgi:hypothetical protein
MLTSACLHKSDNYEDQRTGVGLRRTHDLTGLGLIGKYPEVTNTGLDKSDNWGLGRTNDLTDWV